MNALVAAQPQLGARPDVDKGTGHWGRVLGVVAVVLLLVVVAGVLMVQGRDLADRVDTLEATNGEVRADLKEVTASRDALRELFPITPASMSRADLAGTFEFSFVPVEERCSYDDCADFGAPTAKVQISRVGDEYTLSIVGVEGAAPLESTGSLFTATGVLPESEWGTCGGAPSPTSFEIAFAVGGIELGDGDEVRAVRADGAYRQYDSSGLCNGENTLTLTGRRIG